MEQTIHSIADHGLDLRCVQYAKEAYLAAPDITGLRNTAAIVRDCGTHIMVAFRGTQSIQEWLTDAEFVPMEIYGCKIHRGFGTAYFDLASRLQAKLEALDWSDKKPLVLTGHSLGGALALLAAFVLAKQYPLGYIAAVTTFGQPRVGNRAFVDAYDSEPSAFQQVLGEITQRYVNSVDVVPHLPLRGFLLGYRHTQAETWFNALGMRFNNPGFWMQLSDAAFACWRFYTSRQEQLLADHHIDRYVNLVTKEAP